QTFMRMFPRCGVPDVFGSWAEHRRFYELLIATNCIEEFTQVWWSVRPHHRFGTVELRIADAQTEHWQNLAVSALSVGLVAYLTGLYDEGVDLPVQPTRYVEENLWRAIRFGLDGKFVDFEAECEVPAPDALRRLVELAAPRAADIGLQPHLDDVERLLREGNGAQRQAAAFRENGSLHEVFGDVVEQTADAAAALSAPESGGV
ncbi:MAG: glutamate--cysteine ligase, partial [Thermoleophilia bacterium]|nr:glutamate--cysteine ligase [Thermoleophilia bacterium]